VNARKSSRHVSRKKRYHHFGEYLRRTYGKRVQKITIDAGFSCPNRDGTIGTSGCIYCNNEGFCPNTRRDRSDKWVEKQIADGIEWGRRRYKAGRFIAYFQAYTNTYAPVLELKELYNCVLDFPKVIGLAIGTRPDCVSPEILDLIESYNEFLPEVWIEYGLQSAHDRTLERINRGHDYNCFVDAVKATAEKKVKICAHIIFGLPGETGEDMMTTIERVGSLPIHGIKIHLLHVLRDTPLEKEYAAGRVQLLERDEYVKLVCDAIERLPEAILIQRLTGEAPDRVLIAPEWCRDKTGVLEDIDRELERRGACQGCLSPRRQDAKT
jgi:radical SAM protein (TIGR01212 family)